jgi:hypothetical protein
MLACDGKDVMEGIERTIDTYSIWLVMEKILMMEGIERERELLVRGKRYDFFVGTLND